MSALTTSVVPEFRDGTVDVIVTGELTVAGAATLRAAVLKCRAEQPMAVILDLNDLVVTSDPLLAVFLALQHHGDPEVPVPLLLHADPLSRVGQVIRTGPTRFLPVYRNRAAAAAAVRAGEVGPRRALRHLPPHRASPAAARAFVGEFCRRWHLPRLSTVAQVVANELVTNAVRHARTDLTVAVCRGRRYLNVRVRDRDTRIPLVGGAASAEGRSAPGGRGLVLVDSLADDWGTFLHRDGKSVWANLRMGRDAER